MNLKKLESYLRVNLSGPGPRLVKKNIPGRGLTKVAKTLTYSTQTSKSNIKISAFQRILVRPAKVYVNQFLTLSKAIYTVSRGNVSDFGIMFLKLKYTDITKNTYIQS
jgi:hypothetical protein